MRKAALLLAALLLPAVAGGQEWRGPAALEVQVEDAKGRNLAGAEVLLVYLSPEGGGSLPSVLTDSNGKANIGGLAAGRWTAEIRHAGQMSFRAELTLAADARPVVQSASHLMAPGATSTMKVKFSRGRGGAPAPAAPAAAPPADRTPAEVPLPVAPVAPVPLVAPAPAPVPAAPTAKAPVKELPPPAPVAPAPAPVAAPATEKAPAEEVPQVAPMVPPVASAPVTMPAPAVAEASAQEPPPPAPVQPAPKPVPAPAAAAPFAVAPVVAEPPAPPSPVPPPPAPPSPIPPPPAPPPSPVPPPPAPAPPTRARLCVECPPGESAAWGEVAIEGGATAGCPADLRARLKSVDIAAVGALSAEFAAAGLGCRVLAVEIPAGARFTGFRYEAQSAGVSADCLPGRGCPAGGCSFPGEPVLRVEGNRTTLLVAFESTAPELRRAIVAGYSTYNKR